MPSGAPLPTPPTPFRRQSSPRVIAVFHNDRKILLSIRFGAIVTNEDMIRYDAR